MPAGASGSECWVKLVPVCITVLVYETDLRLAYQMRWVEGQCLWRGVAGGHGEVRGREGVHDLSVQDSEGDAGHGVFEVVLSGNTVVESAVGLEDGSEENPMARLQHLLLSDQLCRTGRNG